MKTVKVKNILNGKFGVRIRFGQYSDSFHLSVNFTRNMMVKLDD